MPWLTCDVSDRSTSCAYLTGLVIVTCNLLFDLRSVHASADQLLVSEALDFLDKFARKLGSEKVLDLRAAVQELFLYVTLLGEGR